MVSIRFAECPGLTELFVTLDAVMLDWRSSLQIVSRVEIITTDRNIE